MTTTFFYDWPLWCPCSFSGCEWAYCHGTLLCEFSIPKCGGVLGGNDQNLTWFRPVTWSSGHLGRRLAAQCEIPPPYRAIPFRLVVWLIIGTGLPDPTLESASPSPPQGSIWHRKRVKSGNRCRINVESMPNRPLRRGGRGGFKGVRGACAYNQPHNFRDSIAEGGYCAHLPYFHVVPHKYR